MGISNKDRHLGCPVQLSTTNADGNNTGCFVHRQRFPGDRVGYISSFLHYNGIIYALRSWRIGFHQQKSFAKHGYLGVFCEANRHIGRLSERRRHCTSGVLYLPNITVCTLIILTKSHFVKWVVPHPIPLQSAVLARCS